MENLDKEAKRSLFKKILVVFLGNYSCFATGKIKEKTADIMLYFSTTIGEVPENEVLYQRALDMMNLFLSSRDLVEDKEAFIRPIILKLICLYIALVVSDRIGAMMCQSLGKELSQNWSKSTPESVTLSYLVKKEKNSGLLINECDLLEKYSF